MATARRSAAGPTAHALAAPARAPPFRPLSMRPAAASLPAYSRCRPPPKPAARARPPVDHTAAASSLSQALSKRVIADGASTPRTPAPPATLDVDASPVAAGAAWSDIPPAAAQADLCALKGRLQRVESLEEMHAAEAASTALDAYLRHATRRGAPQILDPSTLLGHGTYGDVRRRRPCPNVSLHVAAWRASSLAQPPADSMQNSFPVQCALVCRQRFWSRRASAQQRAQICAR